MIKPDYHHKAKIALFIIKTNSYHNILISEVTINKRTTEIMSSKTKLVYTDMKPKTNIHIKITS